MVRSLFLVLVQTADCKPVTPTKRGLPEISRRAPFLKIRMNVLEFSTELQNAKISSDDLLKSFSSTDAFSTILKCIRTLTGSICVGVSFQYSYR